MYRVFCCTIEKSVCNFLASDVVRTLKSVAADQQFGKAAVRGTVSSSFQLREVLAWRSIKTSLDDS